MRSVRFHHMAAWSALVLVAASTAHAANEKRLLASVPSLATGKSPANQVPFNSLFERASAAQRAKDFDLALALFQRAAAATDLRDRPLSWMTAQMNACHTLSLQGKDAAADALARDIVAKCEETYGSGDPLTSEALAHLTFVLKQHGRLAEAEPVSRRALHLLEEKYGKDHFLVAHAVCRHGALLLSLGRQTEAEKQLRRALDIAITTDGTAEDPMDLCYFITHLAYSLRSGKKAAEAQRLMETAYAIIQKDHDLSSSHPLVGSILRRQAEYYRDVHQLSRAEELARRCLLRLAARHDVNRLKFYYHDMVAEVYRSILQAKGMTAPQIEQALQKVQDEASASRTATASTEPISADSATAATPQ